MNKAYYNMFKKDKLTLGIFAPIEEYKGDIPLIKNQIQLIQKAENYGFSALWARDIPLHDPNFGDVGQMYDPFIFLTQIALSTSKIALATGSIILPFIHPINLAKKVVSLNNISNGRLALGIATGDRFMEYKAYNIDYENRGEIFRETLSFTKDLINTQFKNIDSALGTIHNSNLLPRNTKGKVPFMITGHSQQNLEYIANHSDAWIYYPRNILMQATLIQQWKNTVKEKGCIFKPFIQSLYINLTKDPDFKISPIHLGYKLGSNVLIELLQQLQNIGVNHIILNLKYCERDAESVLNELGENVLPHFNISVS